MPTAIRDPIHWPRECVSHWRDSSRWPSPPGFAPILLAVALIGWGSSIFHPESSRVAQLASGGRKGLAQSIFQVGGNAGSAFGPLLAALVVIPYGQTSIMWFAPAALLAIGILLRIGNWYKRQLTAATAAPVTATAAAAELPRRKIRRALLILTVLVFSKYFYIACMTNYFTFFLMDKFAFSVQDAQYSLFAFLAASAAGTVIGGPLGDRIGRKYVIWGSILGAAPFALMLPYAGSGGAVVLAILVGLIISSAFSAIVVYATDLMPGRVGMIAGLFFGLMFGLGGLGSAFFGWLADRTSIEFIFRVSALLPLIGDHHGIPARRRTQTMIHYQSPLNFHGHDAIHPPLPLTARHDHTGCRQRRPDRTLVRRAEIFRRDARRPARRDDAADIRADPPLAGQLFRRERSGTDAAPAPARFTVPAGRVGNSAANPFGKTITYGEIAREIARRQGSKTVPAQAVGGAVGHNPVSIIVPRHRVVGSNGSLTGYAGGIERKVRLLALEKADMTGLFAPQKRHSPVKAETAGAPSYRRA